MRKMLPPADHRGVAERDAQHRRDDEAARAFAYASMSANTRRSYGAQWRTYVEYAIARGEASMPADPAIVAAFLASLGTAGASYSRINIARCAIAAAHREHNLPTPTSHPAVVSVMGGIARELGTAQKPKRALSSDQLFAMADVDFGAPSRNARNRALLLMAFAVPLRRSELAALRCSDLVTVDDGIDITVRKSKTNQRGQRDVRGMPALIDVSCCPCVAVRQWMQCAKISGDAPLWPVMYRTGRVSHSRRLSGDAVALIVKAALKAIGVDAADYAGHSLRRGSLTTAWRNGAQLNALMRAAGHRDPKTTLRYLEEGQRMGADNAARYAMGEKKRRET